MQEGRSSSMEEDYSSTMKEGNLFRKLYEYSFHVSFIPKERHNRYGLYVCCRVLCDRFLFVSFFIGATTTIMFEDKEFSYGLG